MLRLVEKITTIPVQDPARFDAYLNIVEELASDSEFEVDSGSAKELYDYLNSILKQYGNNIKAAELDRLNKLILKTKWAAVSGLDQKTREQLLNSEILTALKNNVAVLDELDTYLYFQEFGLEPNDEVRQRFLLSLTHNEERLGTNQIILKSGDKTGSTIGNWLKDFLSYTGPDSNSETESYELAQYLSSSPNAKALSTEEKQILKQIISIYNNLRHPNYVPVIQEPAAAAEDKTDFGPKPQSESYGLSLARPQSEPVTPKPVIPSVPKSKPLAFQAEGPTVVPNNIPASPEKTAFEKRLAEISVATPAPKTSEKHGVDLESLKHRVEEQKIQEVIKSPSPIPVPASKPNLNNPVNTEIKREVSTRELPAHQTPKIEAPKPIIAPVVKAPAPVPPQVSKPVPSPVIKPVMPVSRPIPPPAPAPMPKPAAPVARPVSTGPKPVGKVTLQSLNDIHTLEDLKKIELGNLRQGPLENQTQIIKSKITEISRSSRSLPYYLVLAFEQSPLFKSYLAHGGDIVEGRQSQGDLSQEEFEAVADLRGQVESL